MTLVVIDTCYEEIIDQSISNQCIDNVNVIFFISFQSFHTKEGVNATKRQVVTKHGRKERL